MLTIAQQLWVWKTETDKREGPSLDFPVTIAGMGIGPIFQPFICLDCVPWYRFYLFVYANTKASVE